MTKRMQFTKLMMMVGIAMIVSMSGAHAMLASALSAAAGVVRVAKNAAGYGQSAASWNSETAQKLCDAQNYSALVDPILYPLLDSNFCFVVTWCKQAADKGHVPMQYLYARSILQPSSGNAFHPAVFMEGIVYAMVSLIRTKQDIVCNALRSSQPSDPFYPVLKGKYWYWIKPVVLERLFDPADKDKAQNEKAFYGQVIKSVGEWFKDKKFAAINPVWVSSCSGKPRTYGIEFKTPELPQAAAGEDNDRMRASVLETVIKEFADKQTLRGFFADVDGPAVDDKKNEEKKA